MEPRPGDSADMALMQLTELAAVTAGKDAAAGETSAASKGRKAKTAA
jgi:hypothetical protein